MAKQGMKRINPKKPHGKENEPRVPEIQGKAKTGNDSAGPLE